MNQGKTIQGYRVVSRPTTAGGGHCQWAFAERDGAGYHLKKFLKPKYPLDADSSSAAVKQQARTRCANFERRHRAIMERTRELSEGGGNLVVAHDFFRERRTYFKVTERIESTPLPDPRSLTAQQRAVLLRTLVNSVEVLHRNGIVHGDLKPTNMLFRRTDVGLYTAKLIDFDDSYFAGDPPPPEDLVGDPSHFSPELLQYIKAGDDADARTLTTASDMFALGLVLHRLIAAQPVLPDGHGYPCEWILERRELPLAERELGPHLELVRALLSPDRDARPSAGEVLEQLRDPGDAVTSDGAAKHDEIGADAVIGDPAPTVPEPSRVRMNFKPRHRDVPPPPAVDAPSRVRLGRRLRRTDEDR